MPETGRLKGSYASLAEPRSPAPGLRLNIVTSDVGLTTSYIYLINHVSNTCSFTTKSKTNSYNHESCIFYRAALNYYRLRCVNDWFLPPVRFKDF